ncbi:MAG: hypothetical protein OZ921_04205 [Sorangiineae bacterium]|nr:hypothetical protein [Sorangiineae bacterium]
MKQSLHLFSALAAGAALFAGARGAAADTMVIRHPGDHPSYSFEAEPHLLLGFIDPPGPAGGSGLGVGFRGTVPLVKNGFVSSINNSVGIGFGLDWLRYGHGYEDRNERYDVNYAFIPVVMQWNFFLSRQWSVFGEPGVAFHFVNHGPDAFDPFVLYLGGRWHFTERVTLTMRLGYPAFSVGVSFLL